MHCRHRRVSLLYSIASKYNQLLHSSPMPGKFVKIFGCLDGGPLHQYARSNPTARPALYVQYKCSVSCSSMRRLVSLL